MTLNDWLDLLLRWTHLIAGIAWIGSSFYFIWLDSHLEAPPNPSEDTEGGLWMVHSGGFYEVLRKRVGPGRMPETLHWFKWEAAITWMSGMALLAVVYYFTRGLYLVDPAVSRLTPGAATALGLGAIFASWAVYDALWQSPFGRRPALATAVSYLLAAGAAYGLCHALSGRAAFLHMGALLGTLMVANVWLRILPAQQQMIDATVAGRTPDHTLGDRAKLRSVHNSYMTFPVLFVMLSNHFPGAYGRPQSWLVLVLLMLVGGAARHAMIGKGPSRRWILVPAAAALVAVALLTGPELLPGAAAAHRAEITRARAAQPVPFARVQAIVLARCVYCHSGHPANPTFGAAPSGVSFDDPRAIRLLSARIRLRAVETKTMPLGNVTAMTGEERELLGLWIDQGARAD